ncbi:MAG: DUF952 domain-containing protein [Anaerolineae bacterium]|nr:DUF952 domain-containing protein [Anaerolineae bacterium]MDW8299917.1 DUF952 domain-containing protein [Anaerolineae bacterium]
MSDDAYIYHITTQDAWQQAQREGVYRAQSLETQGFIHFARADQVWAVANAFYRGVLNLLLLKVDAKALGDALRYEPPDPTLPRQVEAAELFPHLYSALPLSAVLSVQPLIPSADGSFAPPDGT